MLKNYGLFLGMLLAICFFCCPISAQAESGQILVNEVMFNPENQTTGEYIELLNTGESDVDLSRWYFKDNFATDYLVEFTAKDFGQIASTIIKPHTYALIIDCDYVDDYDELLNEHSGSTVIFTTKDKTLGNGLGLADKIELYNPAGDLIDKFEWSIATGSDWVNYSYQKIESGVWTRSQLNGTPGFLNYEPSVPEKPSLLLPTNEAVFTELQTIDFSWQKAEGQNYEFILSKNKDLSDALIDEKDLSKTVFKVEDFGFGVYYWQVIAGNDIGETPSEIYEFSFDEPVYSQAIFINEILPNPSGDEESGEWLELYNNSDFAVSLAGWKISDLSGSVNVYTLPAGLILKPRRYLILYRSQTGLILNNDTDGLALFWPNNKKVSETPLFSAAPSDSAWARAPGGSWTFTTTLTPKARNIFTQTKTDQTINSDPISVLTGDVSNYEGKLIKIRGAVIETSGDTFYLDDDSGEVKIYIQAKTNIQKPQMQRSDIFEVVGVANRYNGVWRVLPRFNNDIVLVDRAVIIKKATAKKSAENSTSSISLAASSSKGASPAVMGVKDVETNQKTDNRSDFWNQLIKMIIGFAAVLLIIFVLKLRNRPKPKIVGGHFGDDET